MRCLPANRAHGRGAARRRIPRSAPSAAQAQGPVSGTPPPTEGDTATTAAPGQGCPRRGTDNGKSHHNVSGAPMAILKNARHEKFAQYIAKGMSADASHTAAGYKPSRQNAARMSSYDDIVGRVAELLGSTAKLITDIRDLARECTAEAVQTLRSVMLDGKAPASARVAAANSILDRGHGKAVQHIEAEISVYDSLSLPEKQALLEVIESLLDGDEGNPERLAIAHH